MIENITIDTINLSSTDESTGLRNTAKVYWVDGIARPLPLAQLVMAICLERAAAMEEKVVGLMNELTNTTKTIEDLSWLENILVGYSESGIGTKKKAPGTSEYYWAIDWITIVEKEEDIPEGWGPWGEKGRWTQWLCELGVIDEKSYKDKNVYWKETFSPSDVSKILDAIDTKLDSLNTTSQKTMIMLQSDTTKRDQTYDLITAMVKSIGGANTSIAASMR